MSPSLAFVDMYSCLMRVMPHEVHDIHTHVVPPPPPPPAARSPSQYPPEVELNFVQLVEVFRGVFSKRLQVEVEKEARRKVGVAIGKVDVSTVQDEAAATAAGKAGERRSRWVGGWVGGCRERVPGEVCDADGGASCQTKGCGSFLPPKAHGQTFACPLQ
jgi:hypothetical protein